METHNASVPDEGKSVIAQSAASAEREVIQRRWATSRVTRIPQNGKAVYLKEYFPVEDQGVTAEVIRKRAKREMDVIGRLASLPLGRRLGRLPLVEGDPQRGRLITEEVPGRPLQQAVLGRFRRTLDRECLQAMFLAGRWLRTFQSLPVYEEDRPRISGRDPEDLAEYCDLRLLRMRELGYGWVTDVLRDRVRGAIHRLLAQSQEDDRRLLWCHGDYGAQNILWDGTRLTPLDFTMAHRDFPLTDVTYFIHRLEMFRVYFPWKRWPIAAWRRAVLRGYGRPDAAQSPMYRAMMIRHLHCRLTTYVRRRPETAKERLHNIWVRWRIRQRLLALVGAN